MRLRPEGRDRGRAGDNPAQRSGRLGGLLSRVRRPAVRDSSRVAGERLAPNQEATRRPRGGRSCTGRWLVAPSARDKRSQAPTAAYGPGRSLHALDYERVRNAGPLAMVFDPVPTTYKRSLWFPRAISLRLLKALAS